MISYLTVLSMTPQEVEISDDVYVITAETAEAYKQSLSAAPKPVGTGNLFDITGGLTPRTDGGTVTTDANKDDEGEDPRIPPVTDKIAVLRWSGEVPAQKWMNFTQRYYHDSRRRKAYG